MVFFCVCVCRGTPVGQPLEEDMGSRQGFVCFLF